MNKYALTLGTHVPASSRSLARSYSTRRHRLWIALPVLVFLLFGTFYVLTVNHTAAQGYRMREVENLIEDLNMQNKKMELKVAELQSIKSVQARIGSEQFIPVSHIQYLTPGAPSVALK